MDQFIVSARKYRPALFDSVVGQSHITTTLKNAIKSSHLAQAFLFCGPRGVGKTTCARILAKTINCLNLTSDGEACGACASCVSYQNSSSFNIYELDAASNNSVDNIRELVEQVRVPPQANKYKVYIIDEVHMLSQAAFNAFLKTLEEPPSYAIFILATTEKHKIIPTILSRCQIFDFNRIQLKDIANHLSGIAAKEGISADEEALRLIAEKADGGLRDALSMFDLISTFSPVRSITYASTIENLHILDYDYYFKVIEFLLQEAAGELLVLFDEILKKGFDGHNFIVGLADHLRNLLVCKEEVTIKLLEVSEGVKKKYLEQARNADFDLILSWLNLASQADIQYKSSKHQRLTVELGLMKMAKVNQALQFAQESGDGLDIEQVGYQAQFRKTEVKLVEIESLPKPAIEAKLEVPSPAIKPIQLGKVLKIKGLSTKIEESAATESTNTEVNLFEPLPFDRAWQELVADCWSKNLGSVASLLANIPKSFENNTVQLGIAGSFEENEIQTLRTDLTQFLRQKMANNAISINLYTRETEVETSPVTNQQKLTFLIEQNPTVLALIKKLDGQVY